MTEVAKSLFLGNILHLQSDPFEASSSSQNSLEFIQHGGIGIDAAGKVTAIGKAAELRRRYPDAVVQDFGDAFVVPGFVDGHLHFPQLDMIGSHGETLLKWLERYAFPTEGRFSDRSVARDVSRRLFTEIAANGTTSAVVFGTVHKGATEDLFDAGLASGLRLVIGKTSMDRHGPENLTMGVEEDVEANEDLIKNWHGREGRLFSALTPRFAPSTSEPLLRALSELKKKHPSVYVQTHYAENVEEVEWVKKLFPRDRDYLSVYDRFELLGPKTILAHAIHMTPEEVKRVCDTKTRLCHCPTSNLFLGSGLFPIDQVLDHKISILLGSDIGGGTTLSIWQTMAEAYKVQKLRGFSLAPEKLFGLATLNGAQALGLPGNVTGQLTIGSSADFQVLDPTSHRLLSHRLKLSDNASDILSALITFGDDRIVKKVYVQGMKIYGS